MRREFRSYYGFYENGEFGHMSSKGNAQAAKLLADQLKGGAVRRSRRLNIGLLSCGRKNEDFSFRGRRGRGDAAQPSWFMRAMMRFRHIEQRVDRVNDRADGQVVRDVEGLRLIGPG